METAGNQGGRTAGELGMSTEPTTPKELAEWHERKIAGHDRMGPPREKMEWDQVLSTLGQLPAETPEEIATREEKVRLAELAERQGKFNKICPDEFIRPVQRRLLTDPRAFDECASWNIGFPGVLAVGPTGSAKTRACWQALGRLFVHERKSFAWFPVKRLITEYVRYESKDLAEEFYRNYRHYDMLFIDDLDKFNAQFESESAAIFQFYDWVYREHRPCLTTTNRSRVKWADKMGDAFARRLFDDAHRPVIFK